MPSSSSGFFPAFGLRLKVDGGDYTVTVTRPFVVLDASLLPFASNGAATIKMQRQAAAGGGFADLTDAMICAVIDVPARPALLVNAQAVFDVGDQLKAVIANGAQGRMTLACEMLPV